MSQRCPVSACGFQCDGVLRLHLHLFQKHCDHPQDLSFVKLKQRPDTSDFRICYVCRTLHTNEKSLAEHNRSKEQHHETGAQHRRDRLQVEASIASFQFCCECIVEFHSVRAFNSHAHTQHSRVMQYFRLPPASVLSIVEPQELDNRSIFVAHSSSSSTSNSATATSPITSSMPASSSKVVLKRPNTIALSTEPSSSTDSTWNGDSSRGSVNLLGKRLKLTPDTYCDECDPERRHPMLSWNFERHYADKHSESKRFVCDVGDCDFACNRPDSFSKHAAAHSFKALCPIIIPATDAFVTYVWLRVSPVGLPWRCLVEVRTHDSQTSVACDHGECLMRAAIVKTVSGQSKNSSSGCLHSRAAVAFLQSGTVRSIPTQLDWERVILEEKLSEYQVNQLRHFQEQSNALGVDLCTPDHPIEPRMFSCLHVTPRAEPHPHFARLGRVPVRLRDGVLHCPCVANRQCVHTLLVGIFLRVKFPLLYETLQMQAGEEKLPHDDEECGDDHHDFAPSGSEADVKFRLQQRYSSFNENIWNANSVRNAYCRCQQKIARTDGTCYSCQFPLRFEAEFDTCPNESCRDDVKFDASYSAHLYIASCILPDRIVTVKQCMACKTKVFPFPQAGTSKMVYTCIRAKAFTRWT